MRDLAGKTAVITGAGSGIGRGTALALAEAGMNIVIADIDDGAARAVSEEVAGLGARGRVVQTDVAVKTSVEQLADAAWSEFGGVHLLHNNAGVTVVTPLDSTSDAEWRWLLSINLEGVINGLQVFLPRLKEVEGERHIVNTASIAGLFAAQWAGAYNATKYAVVAISEALHAELTGEGIGVSVLCPGGVNTNIFRNAMNRRPPGGKEMRLPEVVGTHEGSTMRVLDPLEVGRIVRRAIEDNELYILTHPEYEDAFRMRTDRIFAAFERAKRLYAPAPE